MRDLFNDLEEFINKKDIEEKENARNLRKKLSMLAGKLKIHMQREDDFLYPELLNNEKKEVKDMTKKYIAEMGGLADQFNEFNDKYKQYSAIIEDPNNFKKEFTTMSKKLLKRIDREDNKLYPLAE